MWDALTLSPALTVYEALALTISWSLCSAVAGAGNEPAIAMSRAWLATSLRVAWVGVLFPQWRNIRVAFRVHTIPRLRVLIPLDKSA